MNVQNNTPNNQDTGNITVNIVVNMVNTDNIVNEVMEKMTNVGLSEQEMQIIYEKMLEKLALTNLQTSYGLNNPTI